jgi:hypothetical protein
MFDSQKLFWDKASFFDERDAFIPFVDRITPSYLGGKRILPGVRQAMMREKMVAVHRAYDHGKVRPLSDAIWRQLDDSRSWWTLTPADVNRELFEGRVSDPVGIVSDMIDTFNTGKVIAPIVAVSKVNHNKQYRLVSGNLQLMICRSSRIIPKCVFIELE